MEQKYKIISLQEEDEKNQNDFNIESFHPTPTTKEKTLTKPDFSPILSEETQFRFKTNGSYKKRKFLMPETPIKLIKKNYSTFIKIEGKDLFNIKKDKSFCRKLNFDDDEEAQKVQNIKQKDNLEENNSLCLKIFGKSIYDNNSLFLKQGKMEKEFIIIRTLKSNKLDSVYKVKEKKTGNIFCIKKIYKNSSKNNIKNLINLSNDINNTKLNDTPLLGYNFCNHYKDFWFESENENLEIVYKDVYISKEFLYILYDYYPNGDLLDYLEKLEINNYQFTPDFYWDIIFEMIVGLKYLHELGYLHLDIKPTNFLVDKNGYLKLSDFGLSNRISEIPFLTDIIEGDKVYISKELLNFNSNGNLNTKADIFSLGLSIFEILAKINLPACGDSWAELRGDNYQIKSNLLENWNIDGNKEHFIQLITRMIAPIDKRPDLQELIKDFDELTKRYESLKNNNYKKSIYIPELKDSISNNNNSLID